MRKIIEEIKSPLFIAYHDKVGMIRQGGGLFWLVDGIPFPSHLLEVSAYLWSPFERYCLDQPQYPGLPHC